MTLFAIMATASLAILAFHLVRPNFQNLRISIARLLPTPPASAARRYRFPSLPKLRSVPFWARILSCIALLTLLWPQTPISSTSPAAGLGLRIVLDISPSLQVRESAAAGAAQRIELAFEVARSAIALARQISPETGQFCLDLRLAGADISPATEDILAQDPATFLGHQGAGSQILKRALSLPNPNNCSISHILVISDQAENLGEMPSTGPIILWHQIGSPRPNLAIQSIAITPTGLGELQPSLDITLRSFGTATSPPLLTVETPAGLAVPALRPDPSQPNLWHARLDNVQAGLYRAQLDDGGAFSGDDQAIFTIQDSGFLGFDWQFDMAPPPGLPLAARGDGILVTSLAQLAGSEPQRPYVALYDGGPPDPQRQTRIGPFLDAHPILQMLDFDAFERAAPRPAPQLPPEMIAALQNENGLAYLGLRDAPRSVVIAAPLAPMPFGAGASSASHDAFTVSNILFFAAIDWVAQGYQPPDLNLLWRDTSGQAILDPQFESDTARALSPPPDYAQLTLGPTAIRSRTVDYPQNFDWILLFALSLLLVERLFGQFWRSGTSR